MTHKDCDNLSGAFLCKTAAVRADFEPSAARMQMRIRNMVKTDLERAGKILFEAFRDGATKHGYAPRMQSAQEGTSWAWSMFRHRPGEILIAEIENQAAGICCLNPRGHIGGVGPVAVDPCFQGFGIGRQLMNSLLEKAEGLQSLRLFQEAFNPASFSLYYSLNFMPVAELLDLFLVEGARKGVNPRGTVSEVKQQDLEAVYIYDLPRSKLDRRADLAHYLKWGKIFVYRYQSRIAGFLACLPGIRSVQLGPLVADREEEASYLFEHALGVFSGRACQTRVMARDYLLVRTLQGSGFVLYCQNVLMVRGSWRPGRSVEAFGRFPEGA